VGFALSRREFLVAAGLAGTAVWLAPHQLFAEDLKKMDVPTLFLHGDDDQIVPIADSAMLAVKLVKNGTLKVYKGAPHGMCTTHKDQVNADLLAFFKA
jgi:non-heme chloroperoxidase